MEFAIIILSDLNKSDCKWDCVSKTWNFLILLSTLILFNRLSLLKWGSPNLLDLIFSNNSKSFFVLKKAPFFIKSKSFIFFLKIFLYLSYPKNISSAPSPVNKTETFSLAILEIWNIATECGWFNGSSKW